MIRAQDIVEKWIERMVESCPEQASTLLVRQPDPFRNPVGYAVRNGLSQLWKQLQDRMDAEAIDCALDAVIRIRALQDISPSEAVGFVFLLRSILREQPEAFDFDFLENRIDQLALAAFDKYMRCHDQILSVRLHEHERMTRPHRFAGKAGA